MANIANNNELTLTYMIKKLRDDADGDDLCAGEESIAGDIFAWDAYKENAFFSRSVANALERLLILESNLNSHS